MLAAVMERRDPSEHVLRYNRVDDDIDDEDLEIWDDAKFSARQLGPDHHHSESGLQDVLDDLRSQRWRYFFSVPKVKFVMYLFFHLVHMGLLMVTVFFRSGNLATGLSPTISEAELFYWGCRPRVAPPSL